MKQLQFLSGLGIAGVVSVLVAQPARTETAQVTGVRLQQTPSGIEVILETPGGQPLQTFSASYGRTWIADIITTRLRLPDGNVFRQDNPAPGIASVTVAPLDANSIRVKIITDAATPSAQILTRNGNLVLSLSATPGTTAIRPRPDAPIPPTGEPGVQIPPSTTTLPGEEPDVSIPSVGTTPSTTEPGLPPLPGTEPGVQTPSIGEQPGTPIPPTAAPGVSTPPGSVTPTEESVEIVVTGTPDSQYVAPTATAATRTNTPLRDIPQSIQAVPEQVLEDQQVQRLEDAVRNVSGVSVGNTFGGTRDQFNIRGFTQDVILRNGFRESQSTLRETANVERVEILKGPASVLYGNLQPGGVVNLVTKQPLREPFYAAELSIGSFATYRPSIDISGPLNADRTVLYRLNAVYENSQGFRDFDQGIDRLFISPIVTWNISENTNVSFELTYLNDERPFDRGLVAIGRGIADIPYDRVLGEPDDVNQIEELSVGYRLEHRFNQDWTLRNAFRFLSSDTFDFRFDSWIIDDSGELDRRVRSNDDLLEYYSLQTNLVGNVRTGPVNHTLLFGVDLARQNDGGVQRGIPGDPSFFLNIYDPVYNAFPRPTLGNLSEFLRRNNSRTDTLGLYVQDQIELLNNLKLLVGGRFDFVDQESRDRLSNTTFEQDDQAFSPRVGIVYQPIQPISLYASFSRSFTPNSGTQVDGSLLEPERGTQYEVGVRGEVLNGRIIANVSAYHITKSNVATTDPDNPDFLIAVGEQRSQGVELDVAGEILPGWNIIASYGYTDAEITEDNSLSVGNQLFNIPRHSASLWTTYEIQQGDFRGLGFGAGVFFVGDREGDLDNTFTLPSYVRTDAAVFYRRDNFRVSLNVKNLFNVDYVQSSGSFREYITPGEPLTFVGSVAIEF